MTLVDQQARPDAGAHRAALHRIADRLGGAARETVRYEYAGKHAHELRAIDALLPAGGRLLDVGGGVGVNVASIARVRGDVRTLPVDRFEEYDEANRMGTAAAALPQAVPAQQCRAGERLSKSALQVGRLQHDEAPSSPETCGASQVGEAGLPPRRSEAFHRPLRASWRAGRSGSAKCQFARSER